jgi:hypothetical protein
VAAVHGRGPAVGLVLSRVLTFNSEVGDSDCLDPRGTHHVNTTLNKIYELLGEHDPAGAT